MFRFPGYGKTMDKRIKSGVEWLLGAIDVDFVRLEEKVRDGLVYSRNVI